MAHRSRDSDQTTDGLMNQGLEQEKGEKQEEETGVEAVAPKKKKEKRKKRNNLLGWKSKSCSTEHGPRLEYETEEIAELAVERLDKKKGKQMKSYHCETCGRWHVRQVLAPTCSQGYCYCMDATRSILKTGYPSKSNAERRALSDGKKKGSPMKVYRCPEDPNIWHLSTVNKPRRLR